MESEHVGEDPSSTRNGRLDSPTSTGDRPSTPEGLAGPGPCAPPNTPRSTTSSTADTLSLPRSLPTLSGENGSQSTTTNTSSLPSKSNTLSTHQEVLPWIEKIDYQG